MGENQERISELEKLRNLKTEYEREEMTQEQVEKLRERMEDAKREKRRAGQKRGRQIAAAAAAAAAVFVALPNLSADIAYAMSNVPLLGGLVQVVTFRDYQYGSERNRADIRVPELIAGENVAVTDTEQPAGGTETAGQSEAQENLRKSTAEINAEIQAITENLVNEFERNLEAERGYQDVMVSNEVIATTEQYFTLKLSCYQGAGSGYQWNYFYTIDLTTGERLELKDLFAENADYITPISEEIKRQMKAQMEADENVMYWLDYEEVPEWSFTAITDETLFYVNADGNIVISFKEGDVAPMYMGVVEFEIPAETVAGIRK